MSKILVLYYSTYGHVEKMAEAVAEGARKVAGATVTLKRVPETVSAEIAQQSHFKTDQKAPIATVDELAGYDAIIFGTPTRFGNMAAQMRNFLDQTGGLWVKGALIGKVGSVFVSTSERCSSGAKPSPLSWASRASTSGAACRGARSTTWNSSSIPIRDVPLMGET